MSKLTELTIAEARDGGTRQQMNCATPISGDRTLATAKELENRRLGVGV